MYVNNTIVMDMFNLLSRISKRAKYSRRRTHDEDADIDFINERNAKFNKKLERFYGTYTADIKQNLERGTAVWNLCALCHCDRLRHEPRRGNLSWAVVEMHIFAVYIHV